MSITGTTYNFFNILDINDLREIFKDKNKYIITRNYDDYNYEYLCISYNNIVIEISYKKIVFVNKNTGLIKRYFSYDDKDSYIYRLTEIIKEYKLFRSEKIKNILEC